MESPPETPPEINLPDQNGEEGELGQKLSAMDLTSNEDFEKAELLLKNNENYFIAWFGPRSKDIFTDPETHETVQDELVEPPPSPADFETETPNLHLLHERVITYFIRSYIHLIRNETRLARRVNFLGKWFVEYCIAQKYFDPVYLPGIKYLSKWNKLNIALALRDPERVKKYLNSAQNIQFEELSDRAKAIVVATKCFFLTSLKQVDPTAKQEAIECMRSVARLDPETFTWHYQLANWARFARRQGQLNSSGPTIEEIFSLGKAYDCCLALQAIDKSDEKVEFCRKHALAGICQCLAEIIRTRIYDKHPNCTIQIGSLSFRDHDAAVKFILENVKSISEDTTSGFPELIRAGEIVCNILPAEFRNLDLAEELLTRAWLRGATNSKANHKLGQLFLQKEDFQRCLKFLRDALEYSPENLPATMDLIYVLMHSPQTNAKEIKTLLEEVPDLPGGDSDRTKTQAFFAEGCMEFVLGNHTQAIQLWLKAQKLDANWSVFKAVTNSTYRYKWPRTLINFSAVKRSFYDYLDTQNLPEEDRAILLKMANSTGRQPYSQVSTNNFNSQQRPQNNQYVRSPPMMDSEASSNWRSGASASNVSDVRPNYYQSYGRGNARPNYRQNSNSGGTSSGYYNGGRQSNNNTDRGRSPSPTSWR